MPPMPRAGARLAKPARRDAGGAYVPLELQDTHLWDARQIGTAETLLREANAGGPSGRHQIEAAIQSVHAARGHLLASAGQNAEAHEALTLAIGLSADPAARRYLQRKQERLTDGQTSSAHRCRPLAPHPPFRYSHRP